MGEADLFDDAVFDATNGGLPPDCIETPIESVTRQGSVGRYLWVIDSLGLKIILEATPNPKRTTRPIVCHTNITGGKPALHGGELWFGADDKVYINNASGRYGNAEPEQWEAVLAYFTFIGYEVVSLPFLFG
ncbi:hypothetical protein J2I47_15565 [Fibrella sp. HMF5335]|uniref:Uncharacterized protein n=1 Tax=Fibrella rubiginis TaxID=2817060 RepID=A0A939K420_9BACT|nr:hypothetical protein [Fibrella rubiginis]MBO0937974.1 hypothetical protein [Fibrella rubiginis]